MESLHRLHGNVQRAVSRLEIDGKIHDHGQFESEIKNAQDFAAALGYSIERITKTLFLRSHDRQRYCVAVTSADRRLDFKSVAAATGVKRLEAAPPDELAVKTGYPRNGVSPLGLADDIAVIVDTPLLDCPTVLVGGGTTAVEIELTPADLVRVSRATVASITLQQ